MSTANADAALHDSQRHLASVQRPERLLDRRPQPFIPVYAELFRAAPDAAGRSGYGLSGSVAVFYSVIIYLQGTPADGRRRSRSEADGVERFSPRVVGAGDLSRMYGWSYDEIQSWAETCAAARACPHCSRGHALLEIDRRIGKRNRYRLVRCQDLSDAQCVPLDSVTRAKRQPTGAADPDRRQQREDAQQAFSFTSTVDEESATAGTLGESPTVNWSPVAQTLGVSPRVQADSTAETVASSSASEQELVSYPGRVSTAIGDPNEPASVDEAKIMVLRGFAALQHIDASNETLAVIARHVEEPEELFGALIFTIALASVEHEPMSPTIAEAAMSRRAGRPVEASDNVRGSDWATTRVLELARRVEPHTTSTQASSMTNEFYSRCLVHVGGDAAEASTILQRVLTDPRICGAPGIEAPLKPLALLRDGFHKGWIWTEAHQDDGSTALGRAYARLNPGDQHEVERIFRKEADGSPLDVARLRRHRITSRQMIDYLRRRLNRVSELT